MNIINRFFLAVVMAPGPLYSRWGIEVNKMRSILTTKLIMDDRRPNTMQATRQRRGNKDAISNATLGTMLVSGLMGLAFLMAFSLTGDYVVQLTFFFGMFITMLCMSLVSDFTSVLIDVRDTQIILPKPVNDITFIAARLLHIFVHVCKMVIPLSLPAFVYITAQTGIVAALAFGVMVFLATLFSIFLINAVYIFILQITTPERFKNVISYIQIAFAIGIYAAYQVLPRMFDRLGGTGIDLTQYDWLVAMPPYWFACAFNTLVTFKTDNLLQLISAVLAVLMPVLSIYLVVKYLAPAFNQKLAMISGSGSATSGAQAAQTVRQTGGGFADRISQVLTGNRMEQAGFMMAWRLMARSRDFKLLVYPSIGYFLVLFVMMVFRGTNSVKAQEDGLMTFFPVLIAYFGGIISISALSQVSYSNQYNAAWVYYVSPLTRPGEIVSGALKAVMVQFYALVALFALAVGLWLGGTDMFPNVLLGLFNQLLIIYIYAVFNFKKLPFSQPMNMNQRGGQLIKTLMMVFASLIIGSVHYLFIKAPAAIGVALLLSATATWLLMRRIRNIDWEEMEFAE
jgi:ABC-2 type transport system permease protein